jgi:hypothetical protein
VSDQVIYSQITKDYAYWIEKRRLGQQKGGHVSGLLTHLDNDNQVKQNILIDVGLGTIEGLADLCEDTFWDEPLVVFITHGHIDHHAELMVLAEIYCTRRGANMHDVRPPLPVFCTAATQAHLFNTHRYGYTGGETLRHCLIEPASPVRLGIFTVTPLAVDHFDGAVIFTMEFGRNNWHKILIGWDMTSLPLEQIERLQGPSLTLIEATTWSAMAGEIGHTGVEDLVQSGFLEGLRLHFEPGRERYGAYLVHYSGWEDPWGMLTDRQLKEKFDETYPALANVVRIARRGQQWHFTL